MTCSDCEMTTVELRIWKRRALRLARGSSDHYWAYIDAEIERERREGYGG